MILPSSGRETKMRATLAGAGCATLALVSSTGEAPAFSPFIESGSLIHEARCATAATAHARRPVLVNDSGKSGAFATRQPDGCSIDLTMQRWIEV
jgi:hypothetical protein